MKIFGIFSTFAAVVLLAQTPQGRSANVRFHVVDRDGDALPYELLAVTEESGKKNSFLSKCQHLTCVGLPYGVYRYVLGRTGITGRRLSDIVGTFRVSQPEYHLTLLPPGDFLVLPDGREAIAEVDNLPGELAGSVIGPRQGKECWIKFINPYSRELFEAAIHADGTFRIYEPPSRGKYVMVVLCDANVVGVQTISFSASPHAPITIDLRSNAGPKR